LRGTGEFSPNGAIDLTQPAQYNPQIACKVEGTNMSYPVIGIHHITACAGAAQQDIDFFTEIVGLRMVKQTVLMDGAITPTPRPSQVR